jgi:Domain of unknown function (DUF6531)
MRLLLTLLFTLSIFCNIHAEGDVEPEPNIAVLGGEPSGIVDGCVNIITGTFIDHSVDMVTAGVQPLALERLYTSKTGWIVHPAEGLCLDGVYGSRHLHHIQSGMGTEYEGNESRYKICQSNYKHGLTNCSSGVINARTNPRNLQMEGKFGLSSNKPIQLINGAGTTKYFIERDTQDYNNDDTPAYKKTYCYDLTKEIKPNGNSTHYTYQDTNDFGTIAKRIATQNSVNQPLNHLRFHYQSGPKFLNTRLVILSNLQQRWPMIGPAVQCN